MVTISKAKFRLRSSLRLQFGLSYLLIIAAVLLLLNTYPLLVSQDLVFHSKSKTMQNSVSVMTSTLAELDRLTQDNVGQAMGLVEDTGFSRILVTNDMGKVLYDTRENTDAVGNYVFYTEIVQALTGNDTVYCNYESGAFRSRVAMPVLTQNRIIGAVYAYQYDTEIATLLQGLQINLLRMSAVIGVGVIVVSFILSHALTGKISELLAAIRKVREGAYSHRAAVRGNDEIAQIGVEFNSLTDRLQVTEEMRRRFVSDASHELKTPLAAIRLLTDSILQTEEIDRKTTREFVSDIGQEAERLSRITEDLLQLTRLDSYILPETERVDLVPVIRRVMRMMEFVADERHITLGCDTVPACFIQSTEDEIHQVVYNLTDNAVKYTGDGGEVTIRLKCQNQKAVLTVSDNGVGVPEEDLPRVFERFYRVDKARSRAAGGTGLGLSIVRDTVYKRGGTIRAENRPTGGARFIVTWPLAGEEVPS